MVVLVIVGLIAALFVVDHLMCVIDPVSRDEAVDIAARVVKEVEQSRPERNWTAPVLKSETFDEAQHLWSFRFSAVGCEYSVVVSRCGAADIAGVYGCEIKQEEEGKRERKGKGTE